MHRHRTPVDESASVFDDCSELSSWLLGWEEVESLLALHSLLTERIIGGESGGVSTDGRIVVRVIELLEIVYYNEELLTAKV